MSKYHIVVNQMLWLKILFFQMLANLIHALQLPRCQFLNLLIFQMLACLIHALQLLICPFFQMLASQIHALKLPRSQFLNLLIFQMLASQIHALQLLRCASIIQEGKFPTTAVFVQIWLHSTMSLRNVTSFSVMKLTVKMVALVLLHRVQSSNAGLYSIV